MKIKVLVLALAACSIIHGNSGVVTPPTLNPANGHLYYLLTPNTWTAAEAEAVSLGGTLATIDDANEDAWV